ncbi:cyanophycin synthetase [Mesobacillus zeae]|uniref:Cyanophycin synthetase n=1 Tax=Mesobacillus zeae TaxID=1917180 RepID=A0A398BC70_9BACI|nr:cyanophycin synthetase [Mesobacillus zeae]RID87769.1 cyanophycin synthetase [Mesobacillus zeae]
MKINRVRYLRGPNYFNYRPMIWIELDLEELEFQPSSKIPGFADKLLEILPGLAKHTCSRGYEGGFAERLREGTWMGHILEHMAIELQIMAGIDVKHGKTITGGEKGIYYVTYEYKEQKSGFLAFELAMDIAGKILKSGKAAPDISGSVATLGTAYYENKLGPSTEAIYEAALAMKIPAERVRKDSLLRLGTGSKQKWVQATITSETPFLAVENSCDKQATKDILQSCGLPVPKGEAVTELSGIFKASKSIGYPLVVKPLSGRQGQGVITNIMNRDELFNVVNCLDKHVKDYIVEKYYEGNDYRLLVVGKKLAAASMRIPPFIIGNGQDSIRKLIAIENTNPLRGEGHEKPMTKIPLNYTVSCFLEKFDLSLDSIPEKGQVVQVVGNANLSTGGQAIDVTEEVHPEVAEIAVNAAMAVGLDVAGIDFISKDISKPFDPANSVIIEVNAAPGIRMHHYPSKGKSRNAGKAIVEHLFNSRGEAAIPVIAVTGTNGKTTTTRLIKHLLEGPGKTIGMTNSDGVYIGNRCIDEGDCSGPISARKVLANPAVDLAVLETARGGMLREGLAFRHCDAAVVTNVDEDHLGLDGIDTFGQLVKLKRLITEVVIDEGHSILNADDPEVAKMAEYTKGQVIFTSLNEKNEHIQQSITNGNPAWFLNDDGWIIHAEIGGELVRFLPAAEIPVTIEGSARHNIANLLQALAAAKSQGAELEILKEKSLTFIPDFRYSKGRFNILEIKGRNVIVDYAHNIAGLQAVFGTVAALKKNRLLTVLSAPGDRLDSDIMEMGKISASQTDLFVIKEDSDLRGRKPLEAAFLLEKAALHYIQREKIHIVPEELEAFRKAWELSVPGDTLLLLYEEFTKVKEFIAATDSKTSIDR